MKLPDDIPMKQAGFGFLKSHMSILPSCKKQKIRLSQYGVLHFILFTTGRPTALLILYMCTIYQLILITIWIVQLGDRQIAQQFVPCINCIGHNVLKQILCNLYYKQSVEWASGRRMTTTLLWSYDIYLIWWRMRRQTVSSDRFSIRSLVIRYGQFVQLEDTVWKEPSNLPRLIYHIFIRTGGSVADEQRAAGWMDSVNRQMGSEDHRALTCSMITSYSWQNISIYDVYLIQTTTKMVHCPCRSCDVLRIGFGLGVDAVGWRSPRL